MILRAKSVMQQATVKYILYIEWQQIEDIKDFNM